jgi:hypothetical protein
MQLENLRHFSNLRDHLRFNVIWHTRYKIFFVERDLAQVIRGRTCLVLRLPESDVIVAPLVTCMDWLRSWYSHAADVLHPSLAFAFDNKMSEKPRSTSPSATQVKKCRNTIDTKEKLNVLRRSAKLNELVKYVRKS